jgi:Domain of unknown function (DUF4214)/Divergent InlB B-repeat domain
MNRIFLQLLFVLLWASTADAVSSLTITWQDNSTNEAGFNVERATSAAGPFNQIAAVGENVTSYVDSNLPEATNFCYRVNAFSSAGASPYTSVTCGFTKATLSLVKAGAGAGQITSSPTGINCTVNCIVQLAGNSNVTLTATAAAGSVFAGWSGACGGIGSCTLTMNSQKSVTANFALSAAPINSFVRQQYLDFLDREPGSAETSAWVNALNNGLPSSSLIEAFMDSEEFYFGGKFIARTYLGILTRDADYAGFRAWLEVLLDGMSREQIVQFFLESGEFQAKFGSNLTNSQFVDRMYANVLLRSADVGGFNAWVGGLNSGQITRAQVALIFLDSLEFQSLSASQNRLDVSLLYFGLLQRDPDPGGFSAWVEALNSGLPFTMAIDAFLMSGEYRAKR